MTRQEIESKVAELYVGILGRAPDYPGLSYWAENIEQGLLSLEDTRAAFATQDQAEYWDIYGGLSNSELVDKIYENFLEREPDVDGKAYWVEKLDSGLVQADHMINVIISAVQDPNATAAQTLIDAQVLANKVEAGLYFTQKMQNVTEVDSNYINQAQSSVGSVNNESSTVSASKLASDLFVATIATSAVNTEELRNNASQDQILTGSDWYEPGEGSFIIDGVGSSVGVSYYNLSSGIISDTTKGITTADNKVDVYSNLSQIKGTSFDDTIIGGNPDKDDWEGFHGLAGNDGIHGGSGYDEIMYHQEKGTDGINFNFQTGTAIDTFGNTDVFSGIEAVRGTKYADTFTGLEDPTQYVVIRGLAGDDNINGGNGYAVARYDKDNSYKDLDGNLGSSGITANLAAGTIIDGYGDTDTVSLVNEVRATEFSDTLIGSDASYKEEFRGNAGDDTMTGAGGIDYFNFGSDDGNDVITDFTVGEDKLEFRTISSMDNFTITSTATETVVQYANSQITLTGVAAITESDFLLA